MHPGDHLPDFCVFTAMLGPAAFDSLFALSKERSIGDVLGRTVVVKKEKDEEDTVRSRIPPVTFVPIASSAAAIVMSAKLHNCWLCVRRKRSAMRPRRRCLATK
jgi:hypothetical protein